METFNKTAVPFRVALGLGQGIDIGLSKGIIYQIGEEKATTMKELQKMYIGAGSTEMYVRIATKRYNDEDVYKRQAQSRACFFECEQHSGAGRFGELQPILWKRRDSVVSAGANGKE